jgi:hypothetical protein
MTQPPMEPPPEPPPPPPSSPDYGSAPYQPPPPSGPAIGSGMRRLAIRIGIPVAAFVGIGAVSALIAGNDDADRDKDGNITSEQDVSVFAVKAGDCLDDETMAAIGTEVSGEIEDVHAIPCKDPHTLEAYHVFDLAGDDYPGVVEAEKQSQQGCLDAFQPFIGVPYDQSTLTFFYLYPQALTWTEADDHSVVCLVGESGGTPTTGTLKGAKR